LKNDSAVLGQKA